MSLSKPLAAQKESIDAAYKQLRALGRTPPTLGSLLGWGEPVPDTDGLYAGRLHPPEQSRVVQAMSWWAVGTGILGISHGKVMFGSGVLIGAGIAAVYWAAPTYGWRRRLDMGWVQVLLWSHMWAGLQSSARVAYFAVVALGAVSYLASWSMMNRGDTWAAIFLHMALTACANISSSILYMYP